MWADGLIVVDRTRDMEDWKIQEGISRLVVVAAVVPFPKYGIERLLGLEQGLRLYLVSESYLSKKRLRATRNVFSTSIRLLLYIIPISEGFYQLLPSCLPSSRA